MNRVALYYLHMIHIYTFQRIKSPNEYIICFSYYNTGYGLFVNVALRLKVIIFFIFWSRLESNE